MQKLDFLSYIIHQLERLQNTNPRLYSIVAILFVSVSAVEFLDIYSLPIPPPTKLLITSITGFIMGAAVKPKGKEGGDGA